jgi:butyryl-CoA dehydrogenase
MEFGLTEEQKMFYDTAVKFFRSKIAPYAEEYDDKHEFCWPAWKLMGEQGFIGLHLPEEVGGSGADVLTTCLAHEAAGRAGVDGGLTLAWGAHTFLCTDTLHKWGNAQQRQKYVPRLASGEWVGAMGLTEPNAGSDAGGLQTTAVKKGNKYVLNGTKMFITNGPIADVLVVYATLDKNLKHMGITGFIVEKDFPGFSVGKKLNKMCVRSSTTSELVFEDCEVPEENRLGDEGAGFLMAMGTVEWDRSALLAPMVGGAEFVLEECARYARDRHQFGRPIASFPAVKHMLADMKIFAEAARMLVYRIACKKDQGADLSHLEASITKLFVGDWGMAVADRAVQLHGGYGLMHEYPVERFFRDTKLGMIGGGTSEIQKTIIARMLMQELP